METLQEVLNEAGKTISELIPADVLQAPRREKLKRKLRIPAEAALYAAIDTSVLGSGAAGIAFCSDGLYWNITDSKIDGRYRSRVFIPYAELSRYALTVTARTLDVALRFTRTANDRADKLLVECSLSIDKSEIGALETLFSTLRDSCGETSRPGSGLSEAGTQNESPAQASGVPEKPTAAREAESATALLTTESPVHEEYEVLALQTYIGGGKNELLWYRKHFSKFSAHGADRFHLTWSWSGTLFGPFFLLHRKCYTEALVSILFALLFSFALPLWGSALYILASGVLSPYLIYRRYRRIRNRVEGAVDTSEERIARLKTLGGTSPATRAVITVAGLLFLAGLVVGLFAYMCGLPG